MQVSAEPAGAQHGATTRVVPKTEEAKLRIKEIIRNTLLFKGDAS